MNQVLSNSCRQAAQAGRFYKAERGALRSHILQLLQSAPTVDTGRRPPRGILVPHAGYEFSGKTAAAVYRTLRCCTYDRVLILAPAHTMALHGAAVAPEASFETPLGTVPVDQLASEWLNHHDLVQVSQAAHATEHAIEVELPFLQVSLAGPFKIVPVVLGRISESELNELTERLRGMIERGRTQGQRWLILASSDTYHGEDSDACQQNDERLRALVENLDPQPLESACREHEVMACGWAGLVATMRLSREFGAQRGMVVDRSDSNAARGGVTGNYVVGYLGAVFI